jgi:hypothetical protein
VRQHVGLEPLDGAGPAPAARGALAPLHTQLEQHLHADTDAQHRTAGGQPALDDARPVDRAQAGHARGERAHARHHQAVAVECGIRVGGDRDVGADPVQRAFRGTQVARSVVQHDDPCHRASLLGP